MKENVMADNPLFKKLRLPARGRVAFINAPAGYVESLGLPETLTATTTLDAPCDFVQVFARDSGELARLGPPVMRAVKPDGVLWFCYPKQRSGVASDLTRDAGWQMLYDAGWRGVASVAVDETWSAVRFRPAEHEMPGDALEAQYAGAKAALRPIYERVLAAVSAFGDDVTLGVRQTYVAFARDKQFAVVQPTTRTRVDVGLKLPGAPFGGRLEPAANTGSGSMTHRVSLTSADEVDDELIGWLRAAYEGTG
jgi:predicted transport protein